MSQGAGGHGEVELSRLVGPYNKIRGLTVATSGGAEAGGRSVGGRKRMRMKSIVKRSRRRAGVPESWYGAFGSFSMQRRY